MFHKQVLSHSPHHYHKFGVIGVIMGIMLWVANTTPTLLYTPLYVSCMSYTHLLYTPSYVSCMSYSHFVYPFICFLHVIHPLIVPLHVSCISYSHLLCTPLCFLHIILPVHCTPFDTYHTPENIVI